MSSDNEMNLQKEANPEAYRFNYKGMHRYVITVSTYRSRKLFTEKGTVMKVLDALRESSWKHHFDIYAYCFLPDELVMIARGKTEYSDMKAFFSVFRSLSNEMLEPALGHPLWKKKYTERVLRKKQENREIALGIFQLPVKAGLVSNANEYPFQGSFVLNFQKTT
jgi:putative transposase